MSQEQANTIERLKDGDDQLFKELYLQYQREFVDWATSGSSDLDDDEALDIFQESITSLYLNVYSGQLYTLDAHIKTYLFAIGKNHILKRHKSRQRFELHGTLPECIDESLNLIDTKFYHDDKAIKVADAIAKIEEPCKSIIEFFYLRNYSYEVMLERLGYKNVKVLKARKWRCLKQLRKQLGW